MVWFLFFLVLFVGVVLWLPLVVEIDSRKTLYKVSWSGILSVWMWPEADRWRWFMQVFFWQKEIKGSTRKPAKPAAPDVQKRRRSRSKFPVSVRRARAISKHFLKAIRIDRLMVDWDTGDFMLNAWLYPVFRLLSGGHRQLSINFFGEQVLAIRLHTRPGLLMLAAMRVFITTKK